MKKLLLPIATIMFILCSSFVLSNQSNNEVETNNLQCSYNVYGDGQTDDGWYLRISYDCDCPDPVVVKISYEIKNGKNGSVRSDETTCTLWNRKGSPIVGPYSNYYDDNTTRYRVKSVQHMKEIDSLEQEEKAFDPRVLIGHWVCYKASGERDERYDMEIRENEGFYTITYKNILYYTSEDNTLKEFPHDTPNQIFETDGDISVEEEVFSYDFIQVEYCLMYVGNKRKVHAAESTYECIINLKYNNDGKLKGSINCMNYRMAIGCNGYTSTTESFSDGCGNVLSDGPGGKWNVYFVKY